MSRPKPRGKYPPNWAEISTQVREAADGRCERCGHLPLYPLNLGVHHLDGDKSNNHPANLVALCHSCHLYVQARFDPSEPYVQIPLFEELEEDWMVNRRLLYQQAKEEMAK